MIVTQPPPTSLDWDWDTKLQYKYILVNHQSWEKLDVNYVHWGVDGDKYYALFVFKYKTYFKQQEKLKLDSTLNLNKIWQYGRNE